MKKIACLLLTFTISILISEGQIFTDYPCYAIANNNDKGNVLYGYSPDDDFWYKISPTGTNKISAIATDSNNGILYAFEKAGGTAGMQGAVGIIDPETRDFTPIGPVGNGMGELGEVLLNNIEGLTYDNANSILYAIHRTPNINDLLFQIDLSTGGFVPGAMMDINGLPADYALVEEIFDSTFNGSISNVSDIAINPETGELYAMYNQNGLGSVLGIIDAINGAVEVTIYDVDEDNLESLGFTLYGELYTTAGEGEDALVYINTDFSNTTILPFISNTDVDFESFDCFHRSVNLGICTSNDQLVLRNNIIQAGLYQSLSVNDDAAIETSIEENSSVIVAAKDLITLNNIEVPSNSDFLVEIRPCGL